MTQSVELGNERPNNLQKSKIVQIVYLIEAPSEWIITELNALKDKGFEVLVCLTDKSGEKKLKDKFDYISAGWLQYILNLISLFLTHPLTTFKTFKNWRKEIGGQLTFRALFLAKNLKERKISHIHAHFASAATSMAMIISDLIGVPFSFTAHAYDIFRDDVNKNLLIRKIKAAQFVRCISAYNKAYLQKFLRNTDDKFHVIHCGVDTKKFAPGLTRKESIFTIISVSNLIEKKGTEYLIKALKILKAEGYPFQAILVGEGPEKENLLLLTKNLNLWKEITFLGKIPHSKLPALYARSDLFILPSIISKNNDMDGIPVVLMEAMAVGIPVISTNISGIPELVKDRETGLLINQRNEKALADAIRLLMENGDLRKKLAMGGKEMVIKEFNIERIAKEIIQMFSKSI